MECQMLDMCPTNFGDSLLSPMPSSLASDLLCIVRTRELSCRSKLTSCKLRWLVQQQLCSVEYLDEWGNTRNSLLCHVLKQRLARPCKVVHGSTDIMCSLA
eukprot:4498378-Amphidinium_carterae.1